MTTQQAYRTPSAALVITEHKGKAFYEAKFRHQGKQVRRRIGPAWLDRSETGEFVARRGRVADGFFTERMAHAAARDIVERYISGAEQAEREAAERQARGVTFRQVAHAYLCWLDTVKGAKPSTLYDHGLLLAEPGSPAKRGHGTLTGHIMAAIGDRPAAKVTTREIDDLLTTIAATGVSARTVNKHRQLVSAIFVHGMKASTFGLPTNPVRESDKRREPKPGALDYYAVEEIEALARALKDRGPGTHGTDANGAQDAEAVRVSAYTGVRQGELLALRWRDVDFSGHTLTISRAMSAGVESSTKSGHAREIPLYPPAFAALHRLSKRENFTSDGDLVFCSATGDPLDGSALRRRYHRAQAAAGLRPLRWHDLRHGYASLLVDYGADVISVRDAMGHASLTTTSRYFRGRKASEQVARFAGAFVGATPPADELVEVS